MHRQGRGFALFEARPRLGGRILSIVCAKSGMAIDLGPTWFWPDTQPLITQLIAELGLADFLQHDEGTVLHLRDPDKKPDIIDGKAFHNGARRLEGGMARLVDALANDLPSGPPAFRSRPGSPCAIGGITSRSHFAWEITPIAEIEARRVVLAVPPRLLVEHVSFEPDLDAATRDAMRATGTWMAAQAKVAVSYDRPFWREAGQSGNAFVTHEQAVIGEIFDACDSTPRRPRLAGFLALVAGAASVLCRGFAHADGKPDGSGVRARTRPG